MRLKEALRIMDKGYNKRKAIRLCKAKDYANDDDCLQNFKNVAILMATLDIDPTKSYGVALIYVMLKIDRIVNLIFRKKIKNPQNESILDNINDLQNYIDLFHECLIEEFNNEI